MNKDHGDAVLLYAQFYGQVSDASHAQMESISAAAMTLKVQFLGGEKQVVVPFVPPLADAKEAHHRLVDLLKAARSDSPDA
jgi:putative heme iron utilization protein